VIKSFIRHFYYPLTILAVFAFFNLAAQALPILPIRTLVSVAFGALLIWVGEYLLPFRRDWLGFDKQAKLDGAYLFFVHGFLGRLLEALALAGVLALRQQEVLPAAGWWPNEWPLIVQVLSLIMLSEFFRYWLHRSCHEFPFLWRFHSVHHSNLKMYWWNVGRFHPVEKISQLCFESILFIFLGVSPLAMAVYFIFYSTNGFFQHCNIDIRLGWLNRLISGPEQHRYHHSYEIHESNNNYGNKTSLYDQLFGSYFLPDSLGPKRYGLHNPQYPQTFWKQMRAPFTAGLDKYGTLKRPTWRTKISQAVIEFSIRHRGELLQKRYTRAGRNLREVQEQTLLRILAKNSQTKFFKEKSAKSLHSIEEYQKTFPLAEYEALRPLFESQDETQQWGTITEKPLFYTQTSGSTNKPKLIPILKETLKNYQEAQALWLYHAYLKAPHYTRGKFLAFSGQKTEAILSSGLEVGATTAHIYASLPDWLKDIYVVPASVYALEDAQLKYLVILRLVLGNPDISFVASANPSTLLKIEELSNQFHEQLLQDLESGGFFRLESIPLEVRTEVSELLQKDPARAQELRALKLKNGTWTLQDLFPSARLVGCWQGGSCRLAYEKVRKHFADSVVFQEIGYVASEGRMGIPISHGLGELPSLFDYFFEFQDVNAEGEGLSEIYTLDQLQVGKEYLVIITTPAGLYRYQMNDIVEVTGMQLNVPLIRFKRKGSGVTSITGEKLYENQFLEAVSLLEPTHKSGLEMMLIAHEEKSHYIGFCETPLAAAEMKKLAEELDLALRKTNIEYDAKRDSQRLGPCQVQKMKKGFFHHFSHQEVTIKNIRESQWKLKALNTFNGFIKISPDWQKWIHHD
jgi:sterol desaturase/sphingolipid hydroxylase (fatty acid hydroxylase superfamily)